MNKSVLESHLKKNAIQRNFDKLVKGTTADKGNISQKCYAKGLIPEAQIDEDMSKILQTIQNRIISDSLGMAFEIFLDILTSDECNKYLADLLTKTLEELMQSKYSSEIQNSKSGLYHDDGISHPCSQDQSTIVRGENSHSDTQVQSRAKPMKDCSNAFSYLPAQDSSTISGYLFGYDTESDGTNSSTAFYIQAQNSVLTSAKHTGVFKSCLPKTENTADEASNEDCFSDFDAEESSEDDDTIFDQESHLTRKQETDYTSSCLGESHSTSKRNSVDNASKISPTTCKYPTEKITKDLEMFKIAKNSVILQETTCCEHVKEINQLIEQLKSIEAKRQAENSYTVEVCMKRDGLKERLKTMKREGKRKLEELQKIKEDEQLKHNSEVRYLTAYISTVESKMIKVQEDLNEVRSKLAVLNEKSKKDKERIADLEKKLLESLCESGCYRKEAEMLRKKIIMLEDLIEKFQKSSTDDDTGNKLRNKFILPCRCRKMYKKHHSI